MTTTLPVLPDSFTPLRTPIAEPSFAPKTPLRFGFACRIALVRSVDLSWSPPPYCVATILMFGYLFFIWSVKPFTRSMPVRLVWSCATIATSPDPPMRVAILSAAAPAAAMLSVAAVASGMSLSTPESNPMTGILAAEPPVVAGVPPHAAATRTTAARPPSQRVDLPLMFLSPLMFVSSERWHRLRPLHLPDTIAWDAVLLTGFRQGERISVIGQCYRLAPWVKDARSLARLGGASIWLCSWSSAV